MPARQVSDFAARRPTGILRLFELQVAGYR
jgi:hypothetical protein